MTVTQQRKIRLARDEAMAKLRRGGMTLREIGDRFGLTEESVSQAMKRLGVQFPPAGKYRCLHLKTPQNTIMDSGQPRCRECHNRKCREYEASRKVGCALDRHWRHMHL